jgi:Shikimate dehydrogenase substrate binding domain
MYQPCNLLLHLTLLCTAVNSVLCLLQQHCRLPHVYELAESEGVDVMAEVLQSPDFGGASVTIPHKQVSHSFHRASVIRLYLCRTGSLLCYSKLAELCVRKL